MTMDKGEILRDYKSAKDKAACVPPVAQTPEHQIVPEPEPIMAVLEDREITVAEAVERLRREVEDLEKRRLEIDNERAELNSTLAELLGVQSDCTALSRNYWGRNQYE